MKTMKQLKAQETKLHKQIDALEKKLDALDDKVRLINSAKFKLETGKSFGDTFEYKRRTYIIKSSNGFKELSKTVRSRYRYSAHLKDFLTGKSLSPFYHIPV